MLGLIDPHTLECGGRQKQTSQILLKSVILTGMKQRKLGLAVSKLLPILLAVPFCFAAARAAVASSSMASGAFAW